MTTTPDLGLPLIAGQQAQPEITHNEALILLQALLNGVVDRGLDTPPGAPAEGDGYIVGTAPTGAWAGRANKIAMWFGGSWRFVPDVDSDGTDIPIGVRHEGLRVWVRDENAVYVWRETGSPPVFAWGRFAGTAADIAFAPAGAIAATDVQAAIEEVGSEKVAKAGDTMTGPLQLPAGSSGTPALSFNGTVVGFWELSGNLLGRISSTYRVIGGANTLTFERTGGSCNLQLVGESNAAFIMLNLSNDATGPLFIARKARGSLGAALPAQTNDTMGGYQFAFRDELSLDRVAAELRATVIAASPSSTDAESQLVFDAAAAGTATRTNVFGFNHKAGLSMFGANPVIDQDRLHRMRVFTVATLPAAGTAGRRAAVSDANAPTFLATVAGGGAVFSPVIDNGTNWVCA